MRLKKMATLALAGVMGASPALADLVFPSLSYRTGPFAASGIPFADGYADYFTLLNERDGGIGGVRVQVPECETAYNTEKGVECYEATKGLGALVYQPLSTGITYQLIPKVTADGIPMHSMGYGRTSAADGTVFNWIFNYPGTYWDAAAIMVQHAKDVSGGSLEGKTIALLYHNSAYGKEPIRTLEEIAKNEGYNLTLIPVDSPGQEQKSQWLQIRRERPDFVFFWGWGVMNQVAVQEAANIRYPMENFIGVWWSGAEPDVLPAGQGAHGYKSVNFTGVGTGFPIFEDIQTHVVDKGLAAGDGQSIGQVQYNRGLYAAMLAAEAARRAQEIHGVADITPAMMRDGMEALEITSARMAELGLPDFAPEITVTCANHSGPGKALVQQWDAEAKVWNAITDFMTADRSVIDVLVKEDSAAFAAESGITPRSCN
ncbi:ABC transporter substrate-binding protein [Halovulum dunhuangense]|uniref:ABC transporter substrate-binding protein n=1 Tax=Halovulum dunhuangense TaxID=1505036 RepID=A0A849KWV9_9RHOB|nr:ABC transporter substrate-binding protein [Halovulum dunhuangense]NNU78817.1 ABC transporter substrate-binding protein [Halovulum dunhuangense]